MQALIPHFVRMVSLVMTDQLRTVVLNSIKAFTSLWDPFDLVADPHAASAGWPLEKEDGSVEVCQWLNAHPVSFLGQCWVKETHPVCSLAHHRTVHHGIGHDQSQTLREFWV